MAVWDNRRGAEIMLLNANRRAYHRQMENERKRQIRSSYDREVDRYIANSAMQAETLRNLLSLLADGPGGSLLNGSAILDVGCGVGNAVALLKDRGWLRGGSYCGIDLSPKMIEAAQARYRGSDISFAVADAEALPMPDRSFDIVLSNSVLHWLNQPHQGMSPAVAISELRRVLKPAGWVAASIAGEGTGRKFLSDYRALLREHGVASAADDPVGFMPLDETVAYFLEAGLNIVTARMDYEPVSFESSAGYVDAVQAYGYEMFMAPFPEPDRMKAWTELKRRFTQDAMSRPYRHDQYMIYILAHGPA